MLVVALRYQKSLNFSALNIVQEENLHFGFDKFFRGMMFANRLLYPS